MFTLAAQKSIWSSVLALALSGVCVSVEAAESAPKGKEGSENAGKGKTSAAPASPTPTKSATKAPAKAVDKPSDKSAQRALRGSAAIEAEAEENARFEAVRALAFEDAAVKKLRERAETVTGEVEGTKALKEYLKALYGKMRSLEPALKERIDLTEVAALRQLDRPAVAK